MVRAIHDRRAVLFSLIAGLALGACAEPRTPPATERTPALPGLPIEFTARQRSTVPIPASDGRLLVTVDDVTRNQVMVSVATADAVVLVPSRSMTENDAAPFTFDGRPLFLRLRKLANALIGEDYATFEVSNSAAGSTEDEKIELLLRSVAGLDATFVRNGAEHSSTKAAEHLRTKWSGSRARIATARQFIADVATSSSTSGDPYQILFSDGRSVSLETFLVEKLHLIERGR
ncbi:MAG TPA: DUF5329 family protein [Planctomycetota bacterium]|nr:DUF5329 family protein [Planctomycetota bacterium]